ncbi:DUF4123 domain-containing protein [Aeromonas cavernicola]|uniref:Type III secretion protein n=1 Tax=Aeromonas cavernicola TaxID=1006623 RepID=A0A2H9U041_9GAMM|nr:DUF4123 domain-containing protein [Aeromonas cavernicola]PJG57384.1 type III secretion protein [Aeromonas cavernicola]
MSVLQWRNHYQGQLFAIIDGVADSDLIPHFYDLGSGEAFPLFAGTPFADQAAQGPWLLSAPSAEFIGQHPTPSGFYVVSDQPVEVVRRHWQSLIEAIREGEALWLRFSDQRIFLPMLQAMTVAERDSVLGPCAGLWINGQAISRSVDAAPYQLQPRPWFHIRPQHLAALYDESRHRYILQRRLWQTMTSMMERHPTPEVTIAAMLRRANQAGLRDELRDGVVAGALALEVGLPVATIQPAFMLTDDELQQVERWLTEHGVSSAQYHPLSGAH